MSGPAPLDDVDLTAELEPHVAAGLDRHLAAAPTWLPHQYIPWSRGRDFDGPLGGEPWSPDQTPLPTAVRGALVLNLLTEDNLPSYHHALAARVGRHEAWNAWLHRWTAEEERHSHALRAYLSCTRAVDPVALEHDRMALLSRGWREAPAPFLHALVYLTVQELTTRVIHRNTGRACGDPVGERLMARIAADENLHMLFYRELGRHALDIAPDAYLVAFRETVATFKMPGHVLAGFHDKALRAAVAGIYNTHHLYHHVLMPLVTALGLLDRPGLGPAGEQARDALAAMLDRLRRRAALVAPPPAAPAHATASGGRP
ncbi:acyl-ACP desaturase [Yinghuangia sp. ASG 101]|uniref:acyl-ACP desaturase n=1 Tax=Yinghuangia sp. ASG 101 TaxID=2896848 RepID=UPI001E4FF7A9|nr:acyl-ACP desaturase [Yinghuangia sp. ASG 101]UGQ11903.1 acyl-ACP desaturase [Yinghuangia sp. ASG 101]